ncbi:MAG: TIGR04255 family protein [Gammaproteobacteria bacterium]|nr:TIGR04255 family protein [Gammaproteobacteria bacterium]
MAPETFNLLTEDNIPHLNDAPVSEAILQIRFDSEEDFEIERLSAAREILSSKFPNFKEKYSTQMSLRFDEAGDQMPTTTAEKDLAGYMAYNDEGTLRVVFEANSFTFSMLPPYSNWLSFKKEAESIWDRCKALYPKVKFTRAALRYINEISIPLDENGLLEFDDYLTTPPKFPEQMGESIEGFFSRIVIVLESIKIKVIAIQSFSEVDPSGFVKVILDNDVYREEINDFTERDLWDLFDTLRDVKNIIFFSSLTEKAKEHLK